MKENVKICLDASDYIAIENALKEFKDFCDIEVVELECLDANKQIGKNLQVPLSTKVLYIKRTISLYEEVVMILKNYYVCSLNLLQLNQLNLKTLNLYPQLEKILKLKIKRIEEEVLLREIKEDESKTLNIPMCSDIVEIVGNGFTADDRLIEYYEIVMNSDLFLLERELEKGDCDE